MDGVVMTDVEAREILGRLQSGWKFLWSREQSNGDYELREVYINKTGGFAVRDTVIPGDASSRSHSESKALDTEQALAFFRGLDFSETRERLRPPAKPVDAAIEVSPDLSRPHRVIGVFHVPGASMDEAIIKLRDVARREGADAIDGVRQREIQTPGKPVQTMWEGRIVRWLNA